MPPFDVMEEGRMALIMDPTGATVALWEAKNYIGAGLVNTVGAMGWNELVSPEAEKAATFYTALFGWEIRFVEEMNYRRPRPVKIPSFDFLCQMGYNQFDK